MRGSNKLIVSEQFYSIQGEGKTVGIPSVFLRLAGCNLMCGGQGTQFDGELHNGATWRCDSVEVWMHGVAKEFIDVLGAEEMLALQHNAHLIITGGEPLMHQAAIECYLEWFNKEHGFTPYIEIETNGTITPSEYMQKHVDLWNCSAKLSNSGNEEAQRINSNALTMINSLHHIFKFVVDEDAHEDEIIKDYIEPFGLTEIYLMPAGENIDILKTNATKVADIAKRRYWNYTSRLHIELWNQKTGV